MNKSLVILNDFKIIIFVIFISQMSIAQQKEKLPFYEISDYSQEQYTPGSLVARMVDGLGFRFYWATEGLTEKDLAYRANKEGRSSEETIDHILGLSNYILYTALKQPIQRTSLEGLSYGDKRKKVLLNLKKASDIFKEQTDFSENEVVFSSQYKFPFWNLINGPIADALTHCGQILIYRRTTGNPVNTNADVLSGKVRD